MVFWLETREVSQVEGRTPLFLSSIKYVSFYTGYNLKKQILKNNIYLVMITGTAQFTPSKRHRPAQQTSLYEAHRVLDYSLVRENNGESRPRAIDWWHSTPQQSLSALLCLIILCDASSKQQQHMSSTTTKLSKIHLLLFDDAQLALLGR